MFHLGVLQYALACCKICAVQIVSSCKVQARQQAGDGRLGQPASGLPAAALLKHAHGLVKQEPLLAVDL